MPTALGPALALAVTALLPLAVARPHLDHVMISGSTILSRSDTAIAASALVSCIEDDTTLIDKINLCLQDEGSFEENITHRNHISFGILEHDWDKLQLFQQAIFPNDLLLKGKLIRAFRALMGSIYRTHSARLVSPDDHDKAVLNKAIKGDMNSDKNEMKNSTEHRDERTDTTTESPTLPTSTGETAAEDDISNEIAYEGAGSDPKISVIHSPLEDDNSRVTLNTNGPYEEIGTITEKNSYDGEGRDIATTFNEQEVTFSGIDIITKALRDLVDGDFLHSRAYEVSSTTKSSLQITDSYDLKGESPSSIDNITPIDFPFNTLFIGKNEGRGTDIDENEMFPHIEITEKTESEENTSIDHTNTAPNPSAGVKFHIDHTSPTDFNIDDRIPTENSYNSPQDEKSIPNYGIATQNNEEQNSQATKQPLDYLSKEHASKSITTSDSVYATPSYNSNLEGRENEINSEVTSVQERSSVDNMVHQTTLPVDPKYESIPLTNSDPNADKLNTIPIDIDGRKYDLEESSDSVPPDSLQEPVENNEEEIILIDETSPAYPKRVSDSNTPTEIDADKLNTYASSESDTEKNLPVISKLDSTSEKQLTDSLSLHTETREDDDRVLVIKISTMSTEGQYSKQLPYETDRYSHFIYNPTTHSVDEVKHIYSTATSSVYHTSTISPPSTDYGKDDNNNNQAGKFITRTSINYFITEVTESPRDSNDLDKSHDPIEITSAQYTDNYGASGASDMTKAITIPLDNDTDPQDPETKEQYEQKPSIVVNDATEVTTTASHLESDNEYDGNPTEPNERIHKYTLTSPVIVVSPTPQIKVEDGVSSGSGIESYEKPSTIFLDGDRSYTKGIDGLEETTDGNILPIVNDNTTSDIGRGNRTESKNRYHTFSILLPEVQKAKHANAIVNTLRIFPPSNGPTLITQQSYKRGCLSQNDCVRVWNSYNSKQRRNPTGNDLELGGEDLQWFPTGDSDSVVWWHKMKALKKKSR